MALSKEKNQELVKKFGANEKDTGSTKVQIAILTARINALTEHLKYHIHDNHTRRGMFVLIGKRRGLLDYLAKTDYDGYVALCKELGIRK